jgi:hypothetical protein
LVVELFGGSLRNREAQVMTNSEAEDESEDDLVQWSKDEKDWEMTLNRYLRFVAAYSSSGKSSSLNSNSGRPPLCTFALSR